MDISYGNESFLKLNHLPEVSDKEKLIEEIDHWKGTYNDAMFTANWAKRLIEEKEIELEILINSQKITND